MRPDQLPKSVQELLYAEEHRLLDDDAGRAAKVVVQAGVADTFVRNLIGDRCRTHQIRQAFIGPFRLPSLHCGEILLGKDWRGGTIRAPLQFFNPHCLTVGGSGAGKTERAQWLALQIAPLTPGCWLIDLRKAEFARLYDPLQRIGVDLRVVPGRSLKLNPLEVPLGVQPLNWAAQSADLLVHVLQLPARAAKLLHVAILTLYERFGILRGGHDYPTLFDLYSEVKAMAAAHPQARQAVLDSLEPPLSSLGPGVLAYRRGWASTELARRRLVLELGGLAETDKNLILNTLLLSEFTSRVARGISNPRMDLWICCDEAARLIARSNHASNMASLIGLVRGGGIGIDLSVQTTDVLPAVISNCGNKWIGRFGSLTDVDAMGGAMGLTVEQRRWMSVHLEPGVFICQLSERWRHPFVLRMPHVRPMLQAMVQWAGAARQALPVGLGDPPSPGAETVSADDADLGDLRDLPVVAAPEFKDWRAGGHLDLRENRQEAPAAPNLSDAEIRYLTAVIAHPGERSSAYPKLAGIAPRNARRIRQRLCDLGYLREQTVAMRARGRAAIVLEPLAPALQLIKGAQPGAI